MTPSAEVFQPLVAKEIQIYSKRDCAVCSVFVYNWSYVNKFDGTLVRLCNSTSWIRYSEQTLFTEVLMLYLKYWVCILNIAHSRCSLLSQSVFFIVPTTAHNRLFMCYSYIFRLLLPAILREPLSNNSCSSGLSLKGTSYAFLSLPQVCFSS
jgi:hypothetical protein